MDKKLITGFDLQIAKMTECFRDSDKIYNTRKIHLLDLFVTDLNSLASDFDISKYEINKDNPLESIEAFMPLWRITANDLDNSMFLAKTDYIKPALFLLRSALENFLTCFLYRNNPSKMKKWSDGGNHIHGFRSFEPIFNTGIMKELCNILPNFKTDLKHFYETLHKPIHNQLKILDRQRFDESKFKFYLSKYIKVCEYLAIFIVINKPFLVMNLPIFEKFGGNPPSGIGAFDFCHWDEIIPKDIYMELVKLAEKDEDSIGILNWVLSMPDLTDEEIKQSFDWLNNPIE